MNKKITLLIEIPDLKATEKDIEEFIENELVYKGVVPSGNPYLGESICVCDCKIEDK